MKKKTNAPLKNPPPPPTIKLTDYQRAIIEIEIQSIKIRKKLLLFVMASIIALLSLLYYGIVITGLK